MAVSTDTFLPQPVMGLPHALDPIAGSLNPQLTHILTGRRPVVFLDYDGTLTAICDRPQDAILSDEGRDAVAAVAASFPTAVISGRDRADVSALIDLPGLITVGSHGFDVDLPGHPSLAPLPHGGADGIKRLLNQAQQAFSAALADLPVALIERKSLSLAVHYRLVPPQAVDHFFAVTDEVLAKFPHLQEKPGKKVRELVPSAAWDKGKCVLALLQAMGQHDSVYLPLFIGDDRTDEDAFAALAQRTGGGLGIIVADPQDGETANRQSQAAYRLDSPAQVLTFLRRLARVFR